MLHENYQDFLKYSIEITGKNNKIYLIGNESVKHLEDHPSVTFVDINKYMNSEDIKLFDKNFVHYGDKDRRAYFFWFIRLLMLYEFAKDYNFESFVSCDSDNVILKDVNSFPFQSKNALIVPQDWEPFYYGAGVHSSLVNLEFCEIYKNLIIDIFIKKTKIDFIDEKINFHLSNPGSFCDMTIYSYIVQNELIKVDNTMVPRDYLGKKFIFTNSYATAEGFNFRDQYKLFRGKQLIKRDKSVNSNYIIDKRTKEKHYIANIHFQGKQKRFLNKKIASWLYY